MCGWGSAWSNPEVSSAHKKGHRCDTGAAGKKETQRRGDCLVSNLGGRTSLTGMGEGKGEGRGGREGNVAGWSPAAGIEPAGEISERPRLAYSLEGGLVRLLRSEYWLSSRRRVRFRPLALIAVGLV